VASLLNKYKKGKFLLKCKNLDKVFNVEFKEIRGEVLEIVLDYLHHKVYFELKI